MRRQQAFTASRGLSAQRSLFWLYAKLYVKSSHRPCFNLLRNPQVSCSPRVARCSENDCDASNPSACCGVFWRQSSDACRLVSAQHRHLAPCTLYVGRTTGGVALRPKTPPTRGSALVVSTARNLRITGERLDRSPPPDAGSITQGTGEVLHKPINLSSRHVLEGPYPRPYLLSV